jgi:hypothetical protein
MNKYIIISFILLLIIYLYLKKKRNEKFEIPSTSIDVIQNLTNLYVDPSIPITFNNINANSVIVAENLNGTPVPLFTLVEPIRDGHLMRLGSKERGNGWRNYPLGPVQYISMTFSGKLNRLNKGETKNLLAKNGTYVKSDLQDSESYFTVNQADTSGSNLFMSYSTVIYANAKKGLHYSAGEGAIIGFSIDTVYRIDCAITIYSGETRNRENQLIAQIVNIDTVLCEAILPTYEDYRPQHFRLHTYARDITYEGIKIIISLSENSIDGSSVGWRIDDYAYPNVNLAITVEEVKMGI